MKTASRIANYQVDQLPKEMIKLVTVVAGLPAEHRTAIEPVLAQVVESTKRRRRILALVQEALTQLRLDMKYLMFDLEATRRERDAQHETREEENPEKDFPDEDQD